LKRTSLKHRSFASLSDSFVFSESVPEPACHTLGCGPLPSSALISVQDLADTLSADSKVSADGLIRQIWILGLHGQNLYVSFGIID
jgi:hypothetical protein